MFITVSFHNFKSQNFELSVSNPKNQYVVYLSVLSQISNCQSLGRKNKHDILKTDRARRLTAPMRALDGEYQIDLTTASTMLALDDEYHASA